MNLKERFKSETPFFWKKVRTIGVMMLGISSIILASPVALPVGIVSVAGYVATAGGVLGAISQFAVKDDNHK